jgi:hypothetical protein
MVLYNIISVLGVYVLLFSLFIDFCSCSVSKTKEYKMKI